MTKKISTLVLFLSLAAVAYSMQIFIKTPSGKNISIDVEASDLIENVKAKIEDREGYSYSCQVLRYNNLLLEDQISLAEYNIQKEASLYLSFVTPSFKQALPDTVLITNTYYEQQFSDNLFLHAANTLTATQPDGSALPTWLTFNAETRTLSGTALLPTTVDVCITVTNNCSPEVLEKDTFRIDIRLTSAIHPVIAPKVSLAQNPVQQQLTLLSTGSILTNYPYQIINSQGLSIDHGQLSANILPVHTLKAGMYLLKLGQVPNIQLIRFIKH